MKPLIIAFIAACIAFAAKPYLFPATPDVKPIALTDTSDGWTNIHATGNPEKTGYAAYATDGFSDGLSYEVKQDSAEEQRQNDELNEMHRRAIPAWRYAVTAP